MSDSSTKIRSLVQAYFAIDDLPIDCHDDLDALVGLINLVDLLREKGDWIGTVEHGYFLTPRLGGLGRRMADVWRDAAAA